MSGNIIPEEITADILQSHKDKSITAIIKPTNACNLRCKYCYADSAEGDLMSDETLENMITKLQDNYEFVEYLWHGGEPLIAGMDFYNKAVEIQKREKKPQQRIKNIVQTNSTLLNQEWIDFFKENKFNIGISLDGTKETNNMTRVYPDGSGSFDAINNSMNLMRENGMHVGAICILNAENIGHIDEIYDFFKKENIGLKINSIFSDGRAKEHNELAITPKQYGEALKHIFDRWFEEKEVVDVSQMEDFVKMALYDIPISCAYHKTCQDTFVGIDDKGDVYPCGRFVGLDDFKYGNINTDSMSDILNNPKRKALLNREVKDCKGCEYQPKCNGGCIHNAYVAHGDLNKKDPLCTSYKIFHDYVQKAIVKELDKSLEAKQNKLI